MRGVIFSGFLATLALAPLPFASNRPWSWSLLSMIVGLLMLAWAVAAWRDRGLVAVSWRRVWPFLLMFAVIVCWFALQASSWTPVEWHHPAWAAAAAVLGEPLDGAISIDPAMTLAALMRLLSYGGMFWLALQFGRIDAYAGKILWSIALAGFFYSIYGMVIEFGDFNRVLWYERWAYTEFVTSTFINRNSFATYAGLCLLATLGLTFNEFGRGASNDMMSLSGFRWLIEQLTGRLGLLLLMTATIGSALLLTGSRGGVASFAAGLLVLSLGFIVSPRSRPTAGVVITAFSALFVAGVMALSGEVVLSRFDAVVVESQERAAIYRLTLNAILAEPWIGVGYGAFEVAFPMVRDATITTDYLVDKAHNSYLEFAFEAGVPAFALMIGLLGGLVALCLHGIWKRRENRLFPCIGVAAAALVASHAVVDFSIQIPAVAIVFATLLGVASAQSLRRRNFSSKGL
ncbi:MAG: O-antigen ligase family protein [Proteobacteria bacterium]|nr:O-antigen ligase family protein [Pseudomonadota bacterium]